MTTDLERIVMCGVTEYAEESDVKLVKKESGRYVVDATNEGGFNGTEVDLEQLLDWIAKNKPEIYMRYVTEQMMRDYT